MRFFAMTVLAVEKGCFWADFEGNKRGSDELDSGPMYIKFIGSSLEL